MNFLFVDRILELEPRKAAGIKHVTVNDMYLAEHPNGKPMLLACIVGEALGQLNGWCVIQASDFNYRCLGGIVDEVNIYAQAFLGDSILLETQIDHLDDQAATWHGKASINGQTILSVQHGLGPCLPLTDYNDLAEIKQQFVGLNRPGSFPILAEGQPNIPAYVHYYPQHVAFDRILEWKKAEYVVAQKNISLSAPYFNDHFPKNPVLPVSLLLETKLQLACAFMAELEGEVQVKNFRPSKVSKIKMNEFVRPGDVLQTKMILKERNETHFVFSYRSEVNGKRVCVAQAEFKKCV